MLKDLYCRRSTYLFKEILAYCDRNGTLCELLNCLASPVNLITNQNEGENLTQTPGFVTTFPQVRNNGFYIGLNEKRRVSHKVDSRQNRSKKLTAGEEA